MIVYYSCSCLKCMCVSLFVLLFLLVMVSCVFTLFLLRDDNHTHRVFSGRQYILELCKSNLVRCTSKASLIISFVTPCKHEGAHRTGRGLRSVRPQSGGGGCAGIKRDF